MFLEKRKTSYEKQEIYTYLPKNAYSKNSCCVWLAFVKYNSFKYCILLIK